LEFEVRRGVVQTLHQRHRYLIRFRGHGFLVRGFGFWVSKFRVSGFEFRVPGFGFRVQGSVFHVSCLVFQVSCFVFRASRSDPPSASPLPDYQGSGFRVQALEFGV